jgi:hypothetical protein
LIAVDKEKFAGLVFAKFGDRLSIGSKVGSRWRFDGELKPVYEIWGEWIYPWRIEEGIELQFSENQRDMNDVFCLVRRYMRGILSLAKD